MTKKVSCIIPVYNRAEEARECVRSLLKSDYPDFEIILIDNASTDFTAQQFEKEFAGEPKCRLIRSPVNLGAAGGRNLGARSASGDLLLFIDSDNVIDVLAMKHLSEFLSRRPECGIVGPLMCYKSDPSRIWLFSADINMFTSFAFYRGTGEMKKNQYSEIVNVGHIPNCFMVRKSDCEAIGGFDEKFIIMYEEADFAERIKRKLKKKVMIFTRAEVFHNIELPQNSTKKTFHFRTPQRAYLTSRNRVYFMKKNATFFHKFIFFILFFPLSILIYELLLLKNNDKDSAYQYFKGACVGIFM